MAELQIYDSQGQPIREGIGGENQQVKDFFFDGVRIAVDVNRNEMFCFFRARNNDTARSEQYYAQYTYESRSEMSRIYQAVKTRIEGEYGMILDTENEDTRFFELLGSSESGRVPDSSDLDDVESLLSDFESARLGVGSYREAYGLFRELFSNGGVSKIAVSDNATGRSLSSYDLVIETGDYFDMALLGDTEEKVEALRERRRSAFDSDYEDDDNDPISGLLGAALFAGIGVGVMLVLIYGACFGLGMGIPGIGSPPFADSCGGGPSLGSVSAEAVGNGSQEIRIAGGINGMSDTNATVNVTISRENGPQVLNSSREARLNSSGNFSFTVRPDNNGTSLAPGTYNATVEFRGSSKTATFEVENESGTAESESDTPAESIETISGPATVDNSSESVQITGTTTGLAGQNVTVDINISSDDNMRVTTNLSRNVTVNPDETFNVSVPFNATGTQAPYEANVTYNGTTTSGTFGAGFLESVEVLDGDKQGGGENVSIINFDGEITGFAGNPNRTLNIRLERNSSIVDERTTQIEISENGQFDKTAFAVSDSGHALRDGNYTLVATYDGTQAEDEFSVPFPN